MDSTLQQNEEFFLANNVSKIALKMAWAAGQMAETNKTIAMISSGELIVR